MNINTYNKALFEQSKRAFNFSFILPIDPADEQILFCNDTDTVRYKIIARKDKLILYFYFVDIDNVWSFIQHHFTKHYYHCFDIKMTQHDGASALELSINLHGFENINKNFVPPQEVGVLTGKKKFDPLIELLSKRLASIKRNFLASPFEIMLQAVTVNAQQKGNVNVPHFSFYFKADKKEKIWLAFQRNQFTVYFGLSFEDRFEQQLGKIFFSELIDAKKHVHNSPAVLVSQSQLPKSLIDSFPAQKMAKYNFTNGIVSLTLFGTLVKNHRSMAWHLANFRNYAYYHIQAWKCYLHSRVLRRLNIFQRDLNQAKLEPFADK